MLAAQPATFSRRCLSYTDLTRGIQYSEGGHTHCYDSSSSDSEGENPQPIKRSRSDQSLTATAQLAAATAGRSSSGSGAATANQPYGASPTSVQYGVAQQQNAGSYSTHFTRAQRAPSLPVVLSDVGSSTNSLLSLDSEARSASQQHLHLMQAVQACNPDSSAAAGLTVQLGAAAGAGGAGGNGNQGGSSSYSPDSAMPHAGSRQHSSSGFLCSLNPVSSAASLTQAQLWARGYDLPRATSDASLSSGGYSAALQQLNLPLVPCSPPPLLSPGPDAPAALAEPHYGSGGALGLAGSTAGVFKPGMCIQQQKLASFQGPSIPTHTRADAVVVTAALGSSSWGMRAVNSRDSLNSSESITSVEAGERLAGVRFGVHPRHPTTCLTPSPSQGKSGVGLAQLPPLSPPVSNATTAGSGLQVAGLADKRSTSLTNLGTVSSGGVAGSSGGGSRGPFGRPPVPAAVVGSPAAGSVAWWGGSQVLSPGLTSEQSDTMSNVAGASPAIELQSMGSILGGDGQWLFAELSTGAMGALSPVGTALRGEHALLDGQHQQQQQGLPAGQQDPSPAATAAASGVQQPAPSVAVAAPVPVSSCFPAVSSSSMAASCSLPLGSAAAGGFGFGAAPAGAAAAAAAAKLCLFDSAFSRAAAGAPHSQQVQPGMGTSSSFHQPLQPMGARSMSQSANGGIGGSSGGGGGSSNAYGRGVSAPLPHLGGLQGRNSLCGGHGSEELMQQRAYRMGRQDANCWNFSRRGVSLDYSRHSLSSRRRGSLELNMPWRKTLDAAIARAAAESSGPDANDSPRSSGTDSSGRGREPSSGASDADTAVETAYAEADATYGSGAIAPAWQRAVGGTSQLDLLMPLPEADDESLPSPRGCGPGSIGPGSMNSGGRNSYDADVSGMDGSRSSRASSSCGGSIAVDHDLPGSTNVGGYIGATDVLGMARHSLDSPTKAAAAKQQQHQQYHQLPQRQDSYGLEFDGAVVMEAVATGARALMGSTQALMQHLGGSVVSLHSTTTQQQHHMQQQDGVKVVVESGEDSDDDASDGGAVVRDDMLQPLSDSSQHSQPQQGQLAGKRATPEATRKAVAAAAAAAAEVGSMLSGPPSVLGLDGPMPLELQSCTSLSSISSRGSPGFYNRRGAGNGASRDLELFVRLNRARQTLDFAKRQAQTFAELDKAELGVWQALEMLDGLREYEAGLMHAAASSSSGGGSVQDDAQLTPDMSLKEHAFQVAELCRLSFPDKPWMALVGLLHGLGKLLAHPMWGSQPQWAVAGESFPVGCKFAPQISASEFFSANPDRRRRTYSTALGVYQEQCGLRNVYMSWGAAEYLYMLLVLNQTQLPEEALFMIRYQRCYALTRPGGAYRQLMTGEDKQLLPTLAAFQSILQYKRITLPPNALQGQQLYDYYSGLINMYLGEEALFW